MVRKDLSGACQIIVCAQVGGSGSFSSSRHPSRPRLASICTSRVQRRPWSSRTHRRRTAGIASLQLLTLYLVSWRLF